MTTVTGKLIGPADPTKIDVTATLVDVTGRRVLGYATTAEGEIVRPLTVRPVAGGAWTMDLLPNTQIVSDAGDTLWQVTEGRALDGTPNHSYLLVPAAGGPYWMGGLRVPLADAVTGDGSVVYVPGQPGPQGATGPAGADGASAYEVWVAAGNTGTEADFLASLEGPQGPQGIQGDPGDPATNLVTSVNGQQGVVVLGAADVGAEPAGTTAAAVTPLDTRLGAVETTLPAKADKTGATFTGPVNVQGADLAILGDGKAYRFRRGGGSLDLEAAGSDLILSVWANGDFTGDQRSYDRYAAGAFAAQHAGKREFVGSLYGAVRHVIDPDANQIGFFGAPPAGQQSVGGASTGATLAAVVQALGAYGLVADTSTPAAKGVWVPDGWGEHWRAARAAAAAGTGLARIVTVGGSATQGFYASNPITKSWPGLVRTALQGQYGDGGGGFIPSSLSATVLSSGDAAALAAWQTQGAIASQAGTWSLSANRYGPGITGVYTEQTGATMTFTVRGTTVKIFNISGGTRPPFTYSIDGGAPVEVTVPGGAAAVQVTTVTGLSAGTHTVTLTCGTAAAGQYLTVAGVAGENATGVVVDNLARAGAGSGSYSTLPESALNATWNGGVNYPAHLCVYTAGPNDASSDVVPDTWVDNVAAWLRGVRDLGTAQGDTDIIIGLPHLGRHTTANYRYAEYASRLRSLAFSYGAAVVDWWQIGRNSWPYWSTLGYWGTSAGTGAAGSDSVHLSDAGFAAMAAPVVDLLGS